MNKIKGKYVATIILLINMLAVFAFETQAQTLTENTEIAPLNSASNPPQGDTQTITVKASRSNKSSSIDARSYDIQTRPDALSLRAEDIIMRLPGVIVDTNGRISVLGETAIRYSVDGEFIPANIAKQIPATDIERVEIITNPGANSRGNTGVIINIITRKFKKTDKDLALYVEADSLNHGKFTSYYTHKLGDYSLLNTADIEINDFRKNIVSDYIYNNINNPSNRSNDETGIKYSELQLSVTSIVSKGDKVKNGFSLYHSYSLSKYLFNESTTNSVTQDDSIFGTNSRSNSSVDFNNHNFGFSISHQYTLFGKVSIGSAYSTSTGKTDDFEEFDTIHGAQQRFQTLERTDSSIPSFKLSAAREDFYGGNLKYGIEYQQGSKSLSLDYSDITQVRFEQRSKTDYTAFYTSYQFSLGGLKLLPGLRYEQSRIELFQRAGAILVANQTYRHLLPSVHVSYTAPNRDKFSASFARKAKELNPDQLNPNARRTSYSTTQIGNPHLLSSLSDRYEFNYERTREKYSFLLTGYYRIADNDVELTHDYVGHDFYNSRYVNIMKKTTHGINANAKFDINTKLNLALDVHTYKTQWKDSVTAIIAGANRLNTDYKLNLLCSLSDTQDLTFIAQYADKSISVDTIKSGTLTTSLRYSQKLSDSFSFNVELLNIGSSSTQITTRQSQSLEGRTVTHAPMQSLRLSVSKRY